MSNRLLAIGDIHGCHRALAALLALIKPTPQDVLVILGDFVDRGPGSKDVVDQLIHLQSRCQMIPLVGNHEVMMLQALDEGPGEAFEFWQRWGGAETLASYGGSAEDVPTPHRRFLENCGLFWETEGFAFVHANYLPDEPWEAQPTEVVLWKSLKKYRPGPHQSGKTVVMGHSAQRDGEVLDAGHLVCVDTFCYGGGWLTAWDCHARVAWQVDREGQQRLA